MWHDYRSAKWFLSTPPSRVATYALHLLLVTLAVSIHATLAGGDLFKIG